MMKWLLVILFLPWYSGAQVKQESDTCQVEDTLASPLVRSVEQRSSIIEIFHKVEQGVKTGSVDEFEKELGAIVSITIGSNEHGYFSMNQARAVLTSYFSERRPISFEFSRIYEKDSAPYATGRFTYVQKGIQESAQVYISMTLQDSLWVISQFNIY